MELKIKKYVHQRVEVESMVFNFPTETQYFFETGIRRSIRIAPKFIKVWKDCNKDFVIGKKILIRYDITCIYLMHECKIECFDIPVGGIEDLYYGEYKYNEFVKTWVNGHFDERTKEQFDKNFNIAVKMLKKGNKFG
jgi:hypothetical protein